MESYLRIQMLLNLDRFEEAENATRQAISEEPEDSFLHYYLGVVLSHRGRFNEAEQVLRHSIELDPEESNTFAQLGYVYREKKQLRPALEAIDQAIRLNPEEASHYGLKASCLCQKKKWPEAIAAAEAGLQLDAEDETCRMFYSLALSGSGDTAAADAQSLSLLESSPDDSDNHTARGFVILESDPALAEQHFLEALRIDPTHEAAKSGLATTMKLRSPVFGLFLKALLWIDQIPFWGFAIVFVVASRVARIAARTDIAWVAWTGKACYLAMMIFCMMTLVQGPLFDLVLYVSKRGRHALSQPLRRGMKWVCLSFLVAIGSVVWSVFDPRMIGFLHAFLWCGVAGILHEAISCDHRWVRKWLMAGTLVAAICGVGFLAYDFGFYRPRVDAIDAKYIAQTLSELQILVDASAVDGEAPQKTKDYFKQQLEIGTRNDTKIFSETKQLRKNLLFLWGPVTLAIVLVGGWSDDIRDFLESKAPDEPDD